MTLAEQIRTLQTRGFIIENEGRKSNTILCSMLFFHHNTCLFKIYLLYLPSEL